MKSNILSVCFCASSLKEHFIILRALMNDYNIDRVKFHLSRSFTLLISQSHGDERQE